MIARIAILSDAFETLHTVDVRLPSNPSAHDRRVVVALLEDGVLSDGIDLIHHYSPPEAIPQS